jgi:hypothetical protein
VLHIGLDLGKHADPTALCILETVVNKPKKKDQEGLDPLRAPLGQSVGPPKVTTIRPRTLIEHRLRWMRRFDLGSAYKAIVADTCAMMRKPNMANEKMELVVDATGVGVAVVEMFEDEHIYRRGTIVPTHVPLIPITITPGGVASPDGRGGWHVSKKDLVFGLQVVMQNQELAIAAGIPETEAFVTEVMNFKVKIQEAKATDTWEAREGKHDDLVLSVAMAVWRARRNLGITRPPMPKGPGRRFAAVQYKDRDDTPEKWLRGDAKRSRSRR